MVKQILQKIYSLVTLILKILLNKFNYLLNLTSIIFYNF